MSRLSARFSVPPSDFTAQTLRWRPVAPGGVPHALTRDDTYEGYFLPKDTVVLANTWAIHNDEAEYVRPREFMPDRFMNNEYGSRYAVDENSASHRRTLYAFGAGRRVCPGQRLAKNSMVCCFWHRSIVQNCINDCPRADAKHGQDCLGL